MANWFYTDASGQKQGPINNAQFRALVKQGVITPETVVADERGKSAPAGKVKGLVFPEPAEQLEINHFCAKYGTDVKAADKKGLTLLHKAAAFEGIFVLKFLVSQGADIHAKTDRGLTPLHLAATCNSNDEVAKFLVSKGADVNAKGKNGETPLQLATQEGKSEMVALLLQLGAKSQETNQFALPVPVASSPFTAAMPQASQSPPSTTDTPFVAAVKTKLTEKIQYVCTAAVFAIVYNVFDSIVGQNLRVLFIGFDLYQVAKIAVFIAAIILASCVCIVWKRYVIVQAAVAFAIVFKVFFITLGNLNLLFGLFSHGDAVKFIASIIITSGVCLFWKKSTAIQACTVFAIAFHVSGAVLSQLSIVAIGFSGVSIYTTNLVTSIMAIALAICTCIYWKKSTAVQAGAAFVVAFYISFLTLSEPFFLLGGYSSGFARTAVFIGSLILASGICLVRKELLDCFTREFSFEKGMRFFEQIAGLIFASANTDTTSPFSQPNPISAPTQLRIKLNTVNAQLVATYRSLSDAAEQAGWGDVLCESIRRQREDVAVMTSQQEKAAADAELTQNTPSAGEAKQVLAEAKKRATFASSVLDGLREKAGRKLLDDATAPANIGTEQRIDIARLTEEIAEYERVIAHAKTSQLTKPKLVAVSVVVFLVLIGGWWMMSSGGRGESPSDYSESPADIKGNDGWTPLHFAAAEADIEVARSLISKGANVNATTHDGITPLLAAEYGKLMYKSKRTTWENIQADAMIRYLISVGGKR